MITPLQSASNPNQHTDPGISEAATLAVQPKFDDSRWNLAPVTTNWKGFDDADGEAVFRTTIDIPASWEGRDLELSLGAIDDFDTTYWNGKVVGQTNRTTPTWWTAKRLYTIPGRHVRAGQTVIAVRVFDGYLASGISGSPKELFVRLKDPADRGAFYHPDYNPSRGMGDDPARWCPW
jgi:sialate O-acetylesterase